MSVELIVGLGNPGSRYAATRHNVGFRVVDEIARRHAAQPWARAPLAEVTAAWFGPRLVLAKPTTFMNRSGDAVDWLLRHLELEPVRMLVVSDDVDLALGSLRLRRSGGPGTHNGLRHICRKIGTEFPRLRLGVCGRGTWDDLAEYVLEPFQGDELPLADDVIERAAGAVESAIRDGIERAMSSFNKPARP